MCTHTKIIYISCVLLFLDVSVQIYGFQYPDYQSNKRYTLFEGEWTNMPDLGTLTPVKTKNNEVFDFSSFKQDVDYAIRYTAILKVPVDGQYLITQKAGDSSFVFIDGERVIVNDGVEGRRPRTIEKLLRLKSGSHQVKVDFMIRRDHRRVFDFKVEGPDLYRVDRLHWLYFGWENDHPKSWSFMGGAVVPGRRQRVQFTVEIDGQIYIPDEFAENRRQIIKWYLADGYMPSPVSEWKAGPIDVKIQHFANRVLRDKATAVFSRVSLTNGRISDKQIRLNINAAPDREVPLTKSPDESDDHFMVYDFKIPAGETISLDFVACANGEIHPKDLKKAGDFDTNYKQMSAYYNNRIHQLTRPVTLPNQEMVPFYKAAQIVMWESVVKVEDGDVEMRGSGGNPAGYYQYDRAFSHDVPNMVDQFIREGDNEIAKAIMESEYYQRLGRELEQNYLDAIPKYIIPYAIYLQISGDKDYFTSELMNNIKGSARAIHEHRDFKVQGAYRGIMNKSRTLDNPPYYLIVDNFAALHGLAAYQYLCHALGYSEEAKWAKQEMTDLNRCFNVALESSMIRRNVDWYMSTFDDDSYFWENGYDGNWIGTTMMMSTFPWDAYLRGFELEGTWRTAFDRSIDQALHFRNISPYEIPQKSWGAWWGNEYGACYNAGMGLQTLFSEKHRTEVIGNLEFLLKNQSAPFQWGESFTRGINEGDWTRPATDYETWGLGFDKQALLESHVSLKTDGTVIIGRGIPNHWLKDGDVIAWKDVRINGGKKFDFTITAATGWITLTIHGDKPDGNILFNLPLFKDQIKSVTSDGKQITSFDNEMGLINLQSESRTVRVELVRGSD